MILCTTCGKEIELKKQISSLKSQLANIKYLNADEVEKILDSTIHSRYTVYGFEQAIAAICKLAIDIDRDKIIEVLDEK